MCSIPCVDLYHAEKNPVVTVHYAHPQKDEIFQKLDTVVSLIYVEYQFSWISLLSLSMKINVH